MSTQLKRSVGLVAALSLALAGGAFAQSTSSGSTATGTPAGTSAKGAGSSGGAMSSGGSSGASSLSSGDRNFVMKAAAAGMAEVQTGQMAKDKAASDPVKQFGNHMVTDHTQANDQLKQIASTKGVTLPT